MFSGHTAPSTRSLTYRLDHKTLNGAEFFVSIPEYNSLSNLNTLRGLRGAYPRVGVLGNPLARYSLSMRKLCLESYALELLVCVRCEITESDYSTAG